MFPSTSNGVHHNHGLSSNTINTSTTNGRYDDDDDDGAGAGAGGGCIEHQVTQMDTLAGVAIKYGVEVADIKRLNGLATDLQMYALKSLLIPPLRRHPPAPTWTNGTPPHGESSSAKKTPHRRRHSSTFESFQTGKITSPQLKVSPAMSTLQNYYGLKSPPPGTIVETEMALYSTGISDLHKFSLASESPFNRLSKARSNGAALENGAFINDMALIDEKSFRRRQKADAEFGFETPERLIKEENSGPSSFFPAISGRGLASRPKSSTRLAADAESGWLNSTLSAFRDCHSGDALSKVHKSLSTSSLQDQENNSSSAWLTSKWNLKQDLQALSAGPIFDGLPLPKPMSGRKKAALD